MQVLSQTHTYWLISTIYSLSTLSHIVDIFHCLFGFSLADIMVSKSAMVSITFVVGKVTFVDLLVPYFDLAWINA